MSRNDLEPGTAIESQAKGHPATGTEEAGRASQGATHVNESTVGLTNPTGCPPLSHRCCSCGKPITVREAIEGDTCAECLFG